MVMKYVNLGKSGLKVSELCLGTMTYGRETDEAKSHRMMDIFMAKGGNFIDTADVYVDGTTEGIVGRWMKTKLREDIVLATKVSFDTSYYGPGNGPNYSGNGRKHIMDGIEQSLRNLQTDYVDLYLLHCWDERAPLEETLTTMDQLVRNGKIRHWGICNFLGWQLQKAVDLCQIMGLIKPITLQACYNLLDRQLEWDVLPVCKNEGLGLMCWSPLGGGWLTGLVRRGSKGAPENSRIDRATKAGWSEAWENYDTEQTWRTLDEFFAIAQEIGKTPSQLALNWLLQQPVVTAPITGAETIEQLESNLEVVEWSISEDQLNRLNVASEQKPPRYPHIFVRRFNPGMVNFLRS